MTRALQPNDRFQTVRKRKQSDPGYLINSLGFGFGVINEAIADAHLAARNYNKPSTPLPLAIMILLGDANCQAASWPDAGPSVRKSDNVDQDTERPTRQRAWRNRSTG